MPGVAGRLPAKRCGILTDNDAAGSPGTITTAAVKTLTMNNTMIVSSRRRRNRATGIARRQ
jgi:hypothetical protein